MQEIANSLDHFTRPEAVFDHTPHNFARLIQIRRFARQKAHTRAAVGHDRSQWLIDFMCDRSYQLSHAGYAADMCEIRLRLAQRFFGPLAFGYVQHRSNKLDFARLIFLRMTHNMDMFDGTTRDQQAMFKIKILPILRRPFECLFHTGEVFQMSPLEDKLAG